jgi:hypothetical protein
MMDNEHFVSIYAFLPSFPSLSCVCHTPHWELQQQDAIPVKERLTPKGPRMLLSHSYILCQVYIQRGGGSGENYIEASLASGWVVSSGFDEGCAPFFFSSSSSSSFFF